MEKISLGTGVFTWQREERISDRYGFVFLMDEGHNSQTPGPSPSRINEDVVRKHVFTQGRLIAVVKETRRSTHIGDMFHGIRPRRPEVGQVIELGHGELTFDRCYDGGLTVGLIPERADQITWLDIRALYDAHEQSVELFFQPDAE